jgi:hypothetical protein
MTYEYVIAPSERVLSLDPATFGFGYAVLEYEPVRLVAWGTKTCRRDNGTALEAVNGLLRDYQPTAIIIPSWRDGDHPLRGPALDAFIEAIGEALTSPDLEILMCSPEDVREHFARFGTKTKHDVAEYLADEFPELHAILPMPRQNHQPEGAAMTVFDALAFALAARARVEPMQSS